MDPVARAAHPVLQRAGARTIWMVAFLACLAGCAIDSPNDALPSGSSESDIERELLEADARFAVAAAERGLEGWVESFTRDAARIDLHGETARGTEKIRAHDAGLFADPKTRLTWEPTDAGVFDDFRHGYTRGRYELVRREDDGSEEPVSRGSYLTIWRRDDGEWKVLVDTGAPDPPPESG